MADDLPPFADGGLVGSPVARIDGRAKVTGRALYPSDEPVADPAYAFLLTSFIARGRIVRGDYVNTLRRTGGRAEITRDALFAA